MRNPAQPDDLRIARDHGHRKLQRAHAPDIERTPAASAVNTRSSALVDLLIRVSSCNDQTQERVIALRSSNQPVNSILTSAPPTCPRKPK